MNYYIYNENFEYVGVTETEPSDSLWKNIEYLDYFNKPTFVDGVWVEGSPDAIDNTPRNYYRYNESFQYIGVTETKPVDSLWTNVDYIDRFTKPTFLDGVWVEGASDEQLQLVNQDTIKRLKINCYNELQPTDWYFIRKQETGKEVPQNILEERLAIKAKYNTLLGE